MTGPGPLPGKDQGPDELVPDCVQCRLYFEENAHLLVHACASVGIERGKSTRQMFAEHMAALHREHEAAQS